MRGYVLTRYGDASALEHRDVPVPTAGPGEVLIRVHAAGLSPLDIKLRQGQQRQVNRLPLPLVAGNELAGVVAAVGAGVDGGLAEGDRVYARVGKGALGAFAEYAAVPARLVARLPDAVGFAEGAGLALAGQTALRALRDELGVGEGSKVFISAGAGGVGTLAIQLATWLGAEVATTVSPANADLVRELGADHVLDYQSVRITDVLHGYDAALDLVGGQTLLDTFRILKLGGRVASVAGPVEPATAREDLGAGRLLAAVFGLISASVRRTARRQGASYRFLITDAVGGADLALLAQLVSDKHLRVVVDRTYPFDQIADALAYVEAGHAKGKVVVTMLPVSDS